MRMVLKIGGDIVLNGALNRDNILAGANACSVADPENMGIDRLRRHPPPHIQHHIGGLAPDTRQRLQSGAGIGHLAAMVLNQNAAEFDHILGLLPKKPDGFDMIAQGVLTQIKHLLRRIGDIEQCPRGFVDARIRCLRRKRNSHHQRIGIHMLQLALWLGLGRLKAGEYFADRVIVNLLCHRPPMPIILPMRNIRVAWDTGLAYLIVRKTGFVTMNAETGQGYHYHVMRRAIDLIDQSDAALTLEQLAANMDMSPAHFQRLFSTWVGVSPKRYQQYLALGHARAMLADHFTTLETAHNLGLSGTGRLHDLFLRWEAMSPGDYARRGAGLTIYWGWFESPFGPSLVMGTDKGICGIGFAAEMGEEAAMQDLLLRWPKATFVEDPMMLRPWVLAAYGASTRDPTPLYLIGAPFQIKVWEALLTIPSGQVTTYSEIARVINRPSAMRAVGTAVGRNPISLLIPCHRALRKSGALGGYHWGLPVKRAILAWESARAEA